MARFRRLSYRAIYKLTFTTKRLARGYPVNIIKSKARTHETIVMKYFSAGYNIRHTVKCTVLLSEMPRKKVYQETKSRKE